MLGNDGGRVLNDDVVMTNFDHSIDPEVEGRLRATPGMSAAYAAYHFAGQVWYREGIYYCTFWQHTRFKETVSRPTLQEIMDYACEKYGPE